jgi:hypothetical protein
MAALNVKMGDFINVPCYCKKSKEMKDKNTIMLQGYDKNGKIFECHNCFKRFTGIKELTEEAVIEAIKNKKEEENANVRGKKKDNKDGDNNNNSEE